MILDSKQTGYKPLTIYDLVTVRLNQWTGHPVHVHAVNKSAAVRCNRIVKQLAPVTSTEDEILLIDITGWKHVDKTIKGKRASSLRDFCNQYKNAALAIIIYDDSNPATQVIEAVRDILPNLQMLHFSTCNNLAGKHRALWLYAKNK